MTFRKPRIVNRIFYRVMMGLLRGFIKSYFQLKPVNDSAIPPTGAGIILSNHTTLFDPIWVYALLHRPVYFAATEDLFRSRALGMLIRWFGAFPKRKAASDISALRTIFALVEKGGLVGVFPEGVRTWDGSRQPLFTGIAKLIRKLKVPVYVCRHGGGVPGLPAVGAAYAPHPRAGRVFPALHAGHHPGSDTTILANIAAAISTHEFDSPSTATRGRQSGLAVNITRVLYRCPSCGTLEGLKLVRPFSTNRVECSSCFTTWVIDAGCRLSLADETGQAEGAWIPLPHHYKHICDMAFTPIRSEVRLGLAPGEKIFLISRPRFLFKQETFPNLRLFAFGRAFLTSRRLLFRTRIGIPLSAPLAAIGALSVDPGDKLHFTYDGKLYRIPFRNESALKWFDSIHRLQDEARQHKAAG